MFSAHYTCSIITELILRLVLCIYLNMYEQNGSSHDPQGKTIKLE